MSVYVFSTLTASHGYTTWKHIEGRHLPVEASRVLIHGGANLPSKVLVTPKGVMTKISDAEYAELLENVVFQRQKERGFITVEKKAYNSEKIARDLEEKDGSAPMVEKDFTDEGKKPPSTGDPHSDESFDMSEVRSNQRSGDQAETEEKDEEKPKRRGRGRPRKDRDEASE